MPSRPVFSKADGDRTFVLYFPAGSGSTPGNSEHQRAEPGRFLAPADTVKQRHPALAFLAVVVIGKQREADKPPGAGTFPDCFPRDGGLVERAIAVTFDDTAGVFDAARLLGPAIDLRPVFGQGKPDFGIGFVGRA